VIAYLLFESASARVSTSVMAIKNTTESEAGAEPNVRATCDTYGFGTALGAVALAAIVCVLAGASLVGSRPLAGESRQNFAIADPKEGADVNEIKNSIPQIDKPLPHPLRSLAERRQWLNMPTLRAENLRGKVVLVNFWTYSCINSLRPLPYLRAWAEKYKDRGLAVIGVHTPEFAFEHDLAKVQAAAAELPVSYPVAIDNDYGIWNDFDNQAWPGFYFFDASGRLRHRVVGEGGYDQSERLIQKLLSEVSGAPVADPVTDIVGEGAQAAPDWDDLRTPETYVGYARASNFSSPGGVKRDASKLYSSPSKLQLNHWSLSGPWKIGREHAALEGASGKIAFRFHARDLHLVLGRVSGSDAIRFRVTIEGKPPGADHGVDVDAEGFGVLEQDRMYQLIRQVGHVREQTFEIEFFAPGARAYSFTFG
jgi:thiol-disulfide isomerase/thioredoxin